MLRNNQKSLGPHCHIIEAKEHDGRPIRLMPLKHDKKNKGMKTFNAHHHGFNWGAIIMYTSSYFPSNALIVCNKLSYNLSRIESWTKAHPWRHFPRTVGTLYFVSAPDCPIDWTIFVNCSHQKKNSAWHQIVRSNIFPTILFEISDSAIW